MIIRLFISFDPLITTVSPLFLILLPTSLLLLKNNKVLSTIKDLLAKELKVASHISGNFNLIILLSFFLLVLTNNFIGLFPFIFTTTAHLATTLAFALTFWLTTVLIGFIYKTEDFIAHLVPSGCPLALAQFMVLIESVRQVIRPITLSVRLAANITAGHLLLILCSTPIFLFDFISISLLILLILESAVALIQAYVFTVLVSMYVGENN